MRAASEARHELEDANRSQMKAVWIATMMHALVAGGAVLPLPASASQTSDEPAQRTPAAENASQTRTPVSLGSTAASASGLQAVLSLSDDEGKPISTGTAGHPFQLGVTLSDASTGEPPRGLRFDAWLRPAAPGMPSCGDAGRSFRATRRLPADTVDLSGPILAATFDDGAVSLLDPRLDLASANAIAAWSFRMPPAHVVSDPVGTRFLVSFPQTDEVVAIDAIAATLSSTPGSHAAPGALMPTSDGSMWVAQNGRGTLERIDSAGEVLTRHELVPPIALRNTPLNAFVASAADGRHLLVDRASGEVLIEAHGRAAEAIAGEANGARADGIAVASGEALDVLWLDGGRQRFELGARADRVVAARDGRTVFALDRAAGMIAVVDLGTGKALAVESFGEPIGAATATERALFVRAADQARVGVLSIGALDDPRQPSWRTVSLGPPVSTQGSAALDDNGLVVLDPSPQVLALNAATGTASVIADYDAMGDAPPMSAVRIRGGRLRAAALLARRFDSPVPGYYRARTILRNPGPYELVMTAGMSGLTLCLPFEVRGDGQLGKAQARVELLAPSGATGRNEHVELILTRADGSEWLAPEVLVTVSSLSTGWRKQVVARRIQGSRFALPLELPESGSYAVLPDIPGFVPVSAMTVEVR